MEKKENKKFLRKAQRSSVRVTLKWKMFCFQTKLEVYQIFFGWFGIATTPFLSYLYTLQPSVRDYLYGYSIDLVKAWGT